MDLEKINQNILKTILYYDIFSHPLKQDEIFTFLPENTVPKEEIIKAINQFSKKEDCKFAQRDDYFYVKPNSHYIDLRIAKEKNSRRMWKITRFVTHIIKRFPFVRGILITGSLSKNSSAKESDLDFMVITKKNRLWIARTLLMLFKKIFLLNSFKYFCINFLITEDYLEIEDKNIFTATEVVTVKAVFNLELQKKFLESNKWVKEYFPNYITGDPYLHSAGFKVNDRISYFQRLIEIFFAGKLGDFLNLRLKNYMLNHWEKKYPEMSEEERNEKFRSTDHVSKTHPLGMQEFILKKYNEKLRQFDLSNG